MNLKPFRDYREDELIKMGTYSVLPPKLKVKLLSNLATVPSRADNEAAAYDLFAIEDKILKPKERYLFKTDVAIEIPSGYYGQIVGRSGLANKYGIVILGGCIDRNFRGSIGCILLNSGDKEVGIEKGKAIAQLVLIRNGELDVEIVQELSNTSRGANAYGSSGR